MLKKAVHNIKGFTLIEIMVAVVIIGIIGIIIGQMMINGFLGMQRETLKAQMNGDAKTAIEKVQDDIRKSTSVHIYTETDLVNEIQNTGVSGAVICCKGAAAGSDIWFRKYNDRLIRFVSSNGALPANPENSSICSSIKNFEINIKAQGDNLTLYYIKVDLAKGEGKNKVETSLDTQIKKYKTPTS